MNQKELIIRGIKLLDISLLGIYYFFGGILVSLLINKLLPKYDEEKYKKITLVQLIFEISLNVSFIMVSAYFLRKIVQHIPFPLNGYYGYDHNRVSELKGGILISFAIISYQLNLKNKTNLLISKIK
tara:strand:- start:294 stop:674 length:381 start_codon:yes stop_codon:yes gene_type:complete